MVDEVYPSSENSEDGTGVHVWDSNFSQPQEWLKWICSFERIRTATELAAKDEKAQVNMLMYTMGVEADDILRSFKLSNADAKKYSVVID